MLIVTRNEQRLLTSELAVFGLIGRHRRPGWPSSASGVAVIGGRSGRHWRPEWPSLAAGWSSLAAVVAVCSGRLAIIGRGGHLWPVRCLWPGWPSLAWFSRNHQQHADGLLVKGGVD